MWYFQKMDPNSTVKWDTLDPLTYLADHGFNWLRVETHTFKEWQGNMLDLMKQAEIQGMRLCLVLSLNEYGACAGNQKAPPAWKDYTPEQTADALRKHGYETAKYYRDNGIQIDLILV